MTFALSICKNQGGILNKIISFNASIQSKIKYLKIYSKNSNFIPTSQNASQNSSNINKKKLFERKSLINLEEQEANNGFEQIRSD
ncbi:hypothetical protein TTHERM_00249660 (macronuclear) [Tetrahymena thermophila SB210]|uniref:Uncharacterized protein n=1 Tax=Tetrahymena thermophila (strain SB210) TaxID=312017 RepID=Q23QW7_TETTS|nr:hypothetical protein TTHERM_00249660 [Tetrahymena thermophila SB210]EAR98771.1 hypothetical protein TTHERM_00249660 [Tetrahymena thermophila SB210]|eukprot:XP_001019016.1 hypothetical protein TTHERM_00249660 [Tetrahymena thermophila SB210]